MDDADRPTGIFTPEQRKFLFGESEQKLKRRVARQRWYRLRRQVRNGLLDLGLLRWLPREDLELIFKEFVGAGSLKQVSEQRYYEAIVNFLAAFREISGARIFTQMVERVVEGGIQEQAWRKEDAHVDVSAELSVEIENRIPLDEVQRKFDTIRQRFTAHDDWDTETLDRHIEKEHDTPPFLEMLGEDDWPAALEAYGLVEAGRITYGEFHTFARAWVWWKSTVGNTK